MRPLSRTLYLCAAVAAFIVRGAFAADAALFVLDGPDKIEVGQPAVFKVKPAGETPLPDDYSVTWTCNKAPAGSERACTYTPLSFDPVRVEATLFGGGKRQGQVVREVEVVGKKDYGITVIFKLPAVVGPEEQVSGTVVFSTTERFYHNEVVCVMREEPTGRVLREPGDAVRGSDMKPAPEYYVAFKAPKDAGKYTIVAELIGMNSSKDRQVVAQGKFELTVPLVTLSIPPAVTALETFDVSATVDCPDTSLIEEYRWWPAPLISDITQPKAKMQLVAPENAQTGTTRVTLTVLGRDRRLLGRAESQLVVRRANLQSTLPEGWSGPLTSLKRKTATRRRVEGGRETASAVIDAWVNVTVVRNDGSYFNSPERFNREMENDAGSWGAVPERIALAGFSGILYQSPLRADYRSGISAESTPCESSCRGRAVLQNGAYIMNISYFVGGKGVRLGSSPKYWWDDMPFVRQESQAALKEARAIISGLKIVPEGGEIAPAVPAQPALSVRLNAAITTIRKGESVPVTAQVSNLKDGDKIVSYTWSAGVAGKTEQGTFTPDKPGTQSVTVNVKTAQGATGSASLKFIVEDFSVMLKKEKPAVNDVVVGDEISLSCALDGTRPPVGPFYRWKSSGAQVRFDPAEGRSSKTKARFFAAGPVKIWVESYEKARDTEALLATSSKMEMTAAAPALAVTAAEAAPFIGRETVLKISVAPDVKDGEYQWQTMPDTKVVPSRDGKSAVVTVLSTAPVAVTVSARIKGSDVPFVSASTRIAPRLYTARVEVRGPIGAGPLLWKDNALVENKEALSVGRGMRFSVALDPDPDTKVVYAWSAGPQASVDGPADRKDAVVIPAATGLRLVFVSVRDKNGVLLGSAEGSFQVTVSAEDIASAAAKARTAGAVAAARTERAKAVSDILSQCADDLAAGKIDDALSRARAALKDDPGQPKLMSFIDTTTVMKTTVAEALRRVKAALKEDNIAAARQAHAEAAAACAAAPGVVEAKKNIDAAAEHIAEEHIATILSDAKNLRRQGLLDDALVILEKGAAEYPAAEALSKELQAQKEQRAIVADAAARAQKLADQGLFPDARAALSGLPRSTYVKDAMMYIVNAETNARATAKAALPSSDATANDKQKKEDTAAQLKAARSLSDAGKLDEAAAALALVIAAEPNNSEAATMAAELKSKQEKITVAVERMKRMIGEEKLADARRELETARGISEKYAAVVAAEKTLDEAFDSYERRKKDSAEKDKATREAAEKERSARETLTREIQKGIEKARTRSAAGDFDGAIALVKELKTRDAQSAELAAFEKELTGNQAALTAALARVEQLISAGKLDEARAELDKAKAASAGYKPVREAEKALAKAVAVAEKERKQREAQAEKERKAREKREQESNAALQKSADLAAKGDLDGAIGVVEKALKYDNGNLGLVAAKNDYLQRQANKEAAALSREQRAAAAKEKERRLQEEAAAKKVEPAAPSSGGGGLVVPTPIPVPVPVPAVAPAPVPVPVAAPVAGDDEENRKRTAARELFVAAAKLFSEYRDGVLSLKDKYRDFSKLDDAIKKLEVSQRIIPTMDAEELLKNIQGEYGARRRYLATVDRAAKLLKEAARLSDKKQYRESLSVYEESLKLHAPEDPAAVQEAIAKVKVLELGTRADVMRNEGAQLEEQGNIPEALEKYKQALAACDAQYPYRTQIQMSINGLEKRMMSAEGWCLSGEIKEDKGDLKEALADYQKSLEFYDDEGVRKHIDVLKQDIIEAAKKPKPAVQPETAPVPVAPPAASAPAAAPAPEADLIPAVRQLYADMAAAFQATDADRMLSFLADDWMTPDGTKPSQIKESLKKAFKSAVEVRCDIQNVIVIRSGPGMYRARYTIEMSLRIKGNENPRSERGVVNDELAADGKGGVRIKRTINGRFWPAE